MARDPKLLAPEVRNAERLISQRIHRTRLAIMVERAARCFWPAWTVALFAVAAYVFGVARLLSAEWQLGLVVAAGIAFLTALIDGIRHFRVPTETEARARIDSVLPGRPLAALADNLAVGVGNPSAQALWARHLQRMAEKARDARTARPDLRLSGRDPWALRLLGLVALIAGGLFAAGPERLDLTGALPGQGELDVATGPSYEAWANPPAYTGKPTLYLGPDSPDRLDLPVGTEVTLRVYGAAEDHALAETVSGGAAALAPVADGILSTTFAVTGNGRFALSRGGEEVDGWDVAVIPDAPPTIELAAPVTRAVSGAMELTYKAADDYGVTAAQATLTLDLARVDRRFGLAVDPGARDDLVLDLPLPLSGGTEAIEEMLVEDLSKHPWSGLPVKVRLTAYDAAEQDGAADADAILPGRRFFDPLARAIIEQRRYLLWSVENAALVDQMLRTITFRPEDNFTNQTAYMMTRMALRRLGYAAEDGLSPEEQADVAEVLWQAALLVEDGSLSDARERLRRAQDRLSDALRNGATDEEIAELMQELREAMQQYMQQLAQEAMRNPQEQQAQNDQNQMELSQDQLQQLLDRIQELAESGQQEQAEALLNQLRQLLENLQMQMAQGGQGGQNQGQQMMQELQDTLRQQQDLADESFQELQRQFNQQRQGQQGQQGQQGRQGQQFGQQGQPGQGQPGQGQPGQGQNQQQGQNPGQGLSADQLAQRQEALRQMLDDLRGRLPGPSTQEGADARERLGQAEDSMGEARDALDQGDLSGALDRQADALDALREGIRGLGEEMQQQAQQNQGDAPNQAGEGFARDNQDPLGRPSGSRGNIRSDEQMLPGVDVMRRARELFDEIRRRSGDQTRPSEELDYLKRLLDRF